MSLHSVKWEKQDGHALLPPDCGTFWRVEGSLLNLSAVRPVAFFTWNAQSFSERWARRYTLGLLALFRPLLYASNRVFATRLLHTLLRGVSQDRLDLLGEEFFHYFLKPRLKEAGVKKLREAAREGPVILVSQGLDHIMRPLAEYLGAGGLLANRLEFRSRLATGRLLDPVIRPRGAFARLTGGKADGRISLEELSRQLGFSGGASKIRAAVTPVARRVPRKSCPLVLFDGTKRLPALSVRESLAGKEVLLIGATGFIGKVWLVMTLRKIPDIGKIYLLIRRQRSTTAVRRFERIVEESPLFEEFHEEYGPDLAGYLGRRIEVVEGDITQPGLGINPATASRLAERLDLIINSSGLTDFNPDLRSALAINVDGTCHVIEFLKKCRRAALLHLSTCYVAGARDGRVVEELREDYTPIRTQGFDAEIERQSLHALVHQIETRSETPEVTEELCQQALDKREGSKELTGTALENQIRKNRVRWVRYQLVEAGMQRAKELGWPNTYTLTKSLAESLIAKFGSDLPIAVVRPSIVESSVDEPFRGWNEGVNTSAPISYLLGTYFRQLPTNERKCLDLIPVDLICRGLTLISAALVERRHHRLYQLATSAVNPCDMGRSIELTSLAHRKHYRAQEGLEYWLKTHFETIPVSKARYQKLSAPRQKAIVRILQKLSSPFPATRPLLRKGERGLDRVEKLIELYEPFILQNDHVFEARHVELLSQALPPEERQFFGYDPYAIDWWDYWINIHVPALRKWSYPLIEGKPLEPRVPRPFQLSSPSPAPAISPGPRNEATWPYS